MRFAIPAVLLSGCVSIPVAPEPPPPAPVNSGATPPTFCDYTERYDSTNDYLASSGYVLEETGIAFGTRTTRICGRIDNNHFSTSNFSVDIDNYGFEIAKDSDVLVTMTGAAQPISTVGMWVYDDNAQAVVAGGYFVGNHAVLSQHLPAGNYEISVEAYDNQDATAAVDYVLTLGTDNPATRCPTVTGVADYQEGYDGPQSRGNDVIDVDFSTWPYRSFTASSSDAPESMGLPIAAASRYRISGDATTVGPHGSYLDHDTYALQTDNQTNQLSVRLYWPGTGADLDYYLSAENSTFPLASAATVQMGGSEFATFAVEPNTRYWLWVGSSMGSTEATNYDATICGETF